MSYIIGYLFILCGVVSVSPEYAPLFEGSDYELIKYNDVKLHIPSGDIDKELLDSNSLHMFYATGKVKAITLSELKGEEFMSFYEECLLDVVKKRTEFCPTEAYKLFSAGIDHDQSDVNIGISGVDGSDIVFIKGKSKFMAEVVIYNYYFNRVGRLFELIVIMQP